MCYFKNISLKQIFELLIKYYLRIRFINATVLKITRLKGSDNIKKCDICGADVSDETIKHVHIKGTVKNICNGCITAIKGLR
jgi:hypothetical protein